MASGATPPILWHNADNTVILIDIPHSVEIAQGTPSDLRKDHLLSSKPLQAPFATNEPQSKAAKDKTKHNTVNAELHSSYRTVLTQALDEIRSNWSGEWCLPRTLFQSTGSGAGSRKRKRDNAISSDVGQIHVEHAPMPTSISEEEDIETDLLPLPKSCYVISSAPAGASIHSERTTSLHTVRSGNHSRNSRSHHSASTLYPEAEPCTSTLTISSLAGKQAFRIPPSSTFFLGDCSHAREFHTFIRDQAAEDDTRRKFDCILMDPPWPNRSVKRASQAGNHGRGYQVSMNLRDIEKLVLSMDLDILMEDHCLVGMWITNKTAVRQLVLGEGGIFDAWGVRLVEEWIWLKTTTQGEPVVSLESEFRKPYEVFLLGRRSPKLYDPHVANEAKSVKRRVLVGVPDVHSRKPCLQTSITQISGGEETSRNKRILEVFSRHLVAGWWSWGNECLRFNAEDKWKSAIETCQREVSVNREALTQDSSSHIN